MQTITINDYRNACRHHVDALTTYGLIDEDVTGVVFSTGSKTYGNAYRMNLLREGSTGHYQPSIGSDFLGMTRREAYEAVTARTRTIHDMAYVLKLERVPADERREVRIFNR